MENTPTVHADALPINTILGIPKIESKSRSVNNFLQQLNFDPNSIKDPAKAPPSIFSSAFPFGMYQAYSRKQKNKMPYIHDILLIPHPTNAPPHLPNPT